MTSEFSLLYKNACLHRDRIVPIVIKSLRKFGREFMTSGEGSGLKNVWDEICVQFQSQESIHWDAYEDLIHQLIIGILEKEPLPVVELLAYVAQDDFSEDFENLELTPETALPFIKETLYIEAEYFQNNRIKRYLDRDFSGEF